MHTDSYVWPLLSPPSSINLTRWMKTYTQQISFFFPCFLQLPLSLVLHMCSIRGELPVWTETNNAQNLQHYVITSFFHCVQTVVSEQHLIACDGAFLERLSPTQTCSKTHAWKPGSRHWRAGLHGSDQNLYVTFGGMFVSRWEPVSVPVCSKKESQLSVLIRWSVCLVVVKGRLCRQAEI